MLDLKNRGEAFKHKETDARRKMLKVSDGEMEKDSYCFA
jgi:hypothetical protein